jgi:hypothetical protein
MEKTNAIGWFAEILQNPISLRPRLLPAVLSSVLISILWRMPVTAACTVCAPIFRT